MNSSASASFGDFEGYIAARILTLALEKIQGPPTREAIVDALENLGIFDIGLGEPMHLSSTDHQASHRVWPTVLKEGRFLPFQWSDIKALFKDEGAAMKTTERGQAIFWMVRLLGALGFIMVAVLIGQNGLQLQSIRTSRLQLQEEQEHLNQQTREILQRAEEARSEIQAALDENTAFTEKSGAVTNLAQTARQLSKSTDDPPALLALNRLDEVANNLAGVEKQALSWRARYDADLREFGPATNPGARLPHRIAKRSRIAGGQAAIARGNPISNTGRRPKVKRRHVWL